MLRACRRLLRPGGRTAFYTIFISPGLSTKAHRRAMKAGPLGVQTRSDHLCMLRSAGFSNSLETDVTDDYLETARAWLGEADARQKALRALHGDGGFEDRQRDRRIAIAAIEEGLLRRSRFIAEL